MVWLRLKDPYINLRYLCIYLFIYLFIYQKLIKKVVYIIISSVYYEHVTQKLLNINYLLFFCFVQSHFTPPVHLIVNALQSHT